MSMQVNNDYFEWAVVTKKGIRFRSLYYSCPEAIKEKWFERAFTKSWRIKVVVNPYDLDRIYIPHNKREDFIECYIIRHTKVDEIKLSDYQALIQLLKVLRKKEKNIKTRGSRNHVK